MLGEWSCSPPMPLRLLEDAPRACERWAKLRQRHVANPLASLRCRDCCSLRDHELDVATALGEEEVTRPEACEAHCPAGPQLIPARAWNVPPDRAIGGVDEAGAVEAGPARRAAPAVGDADLVTGERDDPPGELLHAGGVARPGAWGRPLGPPAT